MGRPPDRPVDDTSVANASSRARILVVEDQSDVRGLLVTALAIEGHEVDEASSAHEGLRRLQERHYDLVLSDYAMPGGTGTWMLHEARRAGLLTDTAALIVTAYPDARDLSHLEVIPKPLDLDSFLEQVRRVLREGPREHFIDVMDEPAAVGRGHKVEFVLYISCSSPPSALARRNFEQVLERFDVSQVKYSICDLGRDPDAAEGDRVAFTPTLVKRYPAPRMWLIGNLRDSAIVVDILRGCGVDTRS